MKLGELFVDLGVNSGGAFNTLSSFAFKLGNIANLGETVTRYADEFFGEAPKWASNMRMLSRNIDLTTQELQDLEESALVSHTDLNSAIGFYKRLWSEFYNAASTGFQDKGYLEKWSKFFGPEVITELTNNIRKPIDLVNLLNDSLSKINSKEDLMAIRDIFGMSAEMQQTFKLFSYGGVGITNLTDTQIKRLNAFKEAMDALSVESERQHNIWVSKMAPMFTDWAKNLYTLQKAYYDTTESAKGFWDLISKSISYSFGEAPDRIFNWIGEALGTEMNEEGKRRRNEEWIKKYGHPYDENYVGEKTKKQVHSSIDLEKAVSTKTASSYVYSPIFNTSISTDVGSVGKVMAQANQTAIDGARNGRMTLMYGRGTV